MSAMEPSTASQPPGGRDPIPAKRTDSTQTVRTEKPYGNLYHKPVITPGMLKSPILPVWLSKHFRRKDTSAAR
jgi:hypothetical protein